MPVQAQAVIREYLTPIAGAGPEAQTSRSDPGQPFYDGYSAANFGPFSNLQEFTASSTTGVFTVPGFPVVPLPVINFAGQSSNYNSSVVQDKLVTINGYSNVKLDGSPVMCK